MDEYNKRVEEYRPLPEEHPLHRDEFTHAPDRGDCTAGKKLKQRRNRQKLLSRFLCGSAAVVMLTPGVLGRVFYDFEAQENIDRTPLPLSAYASSTQDSGDAELLTGSVLTAEQSPEPEHTIEPVVTEPAVATPLPTPILRTAVCDECKGTGIICPGDPNFGFDRGNGHGYAGCGGTGFSPCPDIWCVNGVRTCQSCQGSGLDRHGDPCEVCGGDGINDCEFCYGTGTAACICADSHDVCARCGGKGTVEEWVLPEN